MNYLPDHTDMPTERAAIARQLAQYYEELAGADGHAERPRFSIARVLQAAAARGPLTGREAEVCKAAALVARQEFNPHRTWIPLGALARSMTANAGAKGGYLVGLETITPEDILRPWSVVAQAGVRLMPGMRDGAQIPKVTGTPTVSWVGETTTAPSATDAALGSVSMTPRSALALTKFSIQLLKQGQAADQFIADQLLLAAGTAIDTVFFAGVGGVQPLGLFNAAVGANTVSGTSLDHADLLAMRKAVLTAGGREDALQWIGSPGTQELLAARERTSGGGRMLWDDGLVLGRPAHATSTAPSAGLVCGDFGKAIVGMFGPGLLVEVDPSQDFNTGGLVARVLVFLDIAFPRATAFTIAETVT